MADRQEAIEPYVVSEERLDEIRALIVDSDYSGLHAAPGASSDSLAAAICDLLAERDEATRG